MDALIYCTNRFWHSQQGRIGDFLRDNGYALAGMVPRQRDNRIEALEASIAHAKAMGWKLVVYCPKPMLNEKVLRLLVGTDFVLPDHPGVTPEKLPALIRKAKRDPGHGRKFRRGWGYRLDDTERRKHLVKARKAASKARKKAAGNGYAAVVPIIRDKRAADWTFQRIADHLNDRGHSLPSGRPFTVFAVMRISKLYC